MDRKEHAKPSSEEPAGEVTRLLHRVRDGDAEAFDRLMPLVYGELRKLAHAQLRRQYEPALQTTALVHELYLKMVDHAQVAWSGRAHFYSLVARAMRQILVDYARKQSAEKRGGAWQRTTLMNRHLGFEVDLAHLLSLDAALERLGTADARQRQVVEFRFFGGMTDAEVAEVLDVSARTVQRDWVKARAWLYRELYQE